MTAALPATPAFDIKETPKAYEAEFIAWDGEGAEADGRYVLLANSLGESIWRDEGIGTTEALRMLVTTAEANPEAVHVCFGASYDVNQMLRDVDRIELTTLWAGGTIRFGRFELTYRPRKSFTVTELGDAKFVRYRTRTGRLRWKKDVRRRMTLWDVFGFFQSPFVDALRKYLTPNELTGLSEIAAGKAARGGFRLHERSEIESYNALECDLLVKLMERLRDHLREAGLPVKRWDGAGAVAATLLARQGAKDALAPLPQEVERAAQHAYAGGRMEVVRYGTHLGPVFHYDINSAYPTAMLELPRLAGGQWEHLDGNHIHQLKSFSMIRARWRLRARVEPELYPFFYREPGGAICYPPEGEGWYWAPEYALAWQLMGSAYEGTIEPLECWTFHPAKRDRPFLWVRGVYEQRARWKRQGKGAEKVLKLGINSLYGKMAQQVGYGAGRRGGRPPFHNLAYAGYITSRTRATLLEAAMQDPASVVMLATDALYATAPRALATGKELGQWDAHEHSALVVAQSGVYWTRDHVGGEEFWREGEFRRGFDRGSVSSDKVRAAWRRGRSSMTARSTRFVTLGSALASDARFEDWRSWRTIDRRLALTPEGTKRSPHPGYPRRVANPADVLVPTLARRVPAPERMSEPYPLLWAGELWSEETVDGVDARTFASEMEEAEL